MRIKKSELRRLVKDMLAESLFEGAGARGSVIIYSNSSNVIKHAYAGVTNKTVKKALDAATELIPTGHASVVIIEEDGTVKYRAFGGECSDDQQETLLEKGGKFMYDVIGFPLFFSRSSVTKMTLAEKAEIGEEGLSRKQCKKILNDIKKKLPGTFEGATTWACYNGVSATSALGYTDGEGPCRWYNLVPFDTFRSIAPLQFLDRLAAHGIGESPIEMARNYMKDLSITEMENCGSFAIEAVMASKDMRGSYVSRSLEAIPSPDLAVKIAISIVKPSLIGTV